MRGHRGHYAIEVAGRWPVLHFGTWANHVHRLDCCAMAGRPARSRMRIRKEISRILSQVAVL